MMLVLLMKTFLLGNSGKFDSKEFVKTKKLEKTPRTAEPIAREILFFLSIGVYSTVLE